MTGGRELVQSEGIGEPGGEVLVGDQNLGG